MTIQRPRRRNSLRYPGYDYTQPGTVFVTICTAGRQRLLGTVLDGHVIHTPHGLAVAAHWQAIPDRFPTVAIDAFVVMPDHLHGIIHCCVEPDMEDATATVGNVVRWFKSSVVETCRTGVRDHGWEPYDRQLWQRAYHDRIVRTDAELAHIQRYIEGNPGRWWDCANADQPVAGSEDQSHLP